MKGDFYFWDIFSYGHQFLIGYANRDCYLISPALLARALPLPAARRRAGRAGAVRAHALPAEAQRRARRARERVALHVVFTRLVQHVHSWGRKLAFTSHSTSVAR